MVDAVLASIGRRIPLHVSREDLASAGKLALVEALLRFAGPTEQARAYCYVRVHGAVIDELRRLDPLSRHARAQIRLVQRARAALERQLGRAPAAAEVARATGFGPETLAQIDRLAAAAQACSADETDADGENLHALVDTAAPCPARSAEGGDATDLVRAALARLAPNQARVVQRYYLEEATLEEIAGEFGLSKERIRQIREAAEKKLREDFVVLALWQSVFNRR